MDRWQAMRIFVKVAELGSVPALADEQGKLDVSIVSSTGETLGHASEPVIHGTSSDATQNAGVRR